MAAIPAQVGIQRPEIMGTAAPKHPPTLKHATMDIIAAQTTTDARNTSVISTTVRDHLTVRARDFSPHPKGHIRHDSWAVTFFMMTTKL